MQPQHVCIAQRGRLFWKCRCTGRAGGSACASGALPAPARGKPWPCCWQTYLASIFLTGHFCMLHFGEDDCLVLVISCFCWIPNGLVDRKNLSAVEQLAASTYVFTYFSSPLPCPPTPQRRIGGWMDTPNKNVLCDGNCLSPSSERLALLGSLPFVFKYYQSNWKPPNHLNPHFKC